LPYQEIKGFATPRRLSVLIKKLNEKSTERTEEYSGPMLNIAKDAQGNFTQAAKGFAAKYACPVEKLIIKKKEKGEYVCIEKKIPGRKAEDILKEIFPDAIKKISFPKSMVWEASLFRFARPIRNILAIFGNKVVKFSLAGVKTNNISYGLHTISRKKITISSPERYETELRNNLVLVDPEKRKLEVKKVIEHSTKHFKGEALVDEDLLAEINYLIEHPVAVVGVFDQKYLKLPQEVLINCMRKKQKFFPVMNKGILTNNFIGIRNGISENQNVVKEGYERVLSARLSDAEFFFHQDTRTPLETKLEKLKGVVFHQKLGTVYEKVQRIKIITAFINDKLSEGKPASVVDKDILEKTCDLSKADLVTEMVFEYPEMQGTVGRIYAEFEKLPKEVSKAIEEHYMPLTADGKLPVSETGMIIALADKIDTLAGYFSIGILPSGSADPYALRRLAAGVLRIILEKKLPVSIKGIINFSIQNMEQNKIKTNDQALSQLMEFLRSRLENILETEGYKFDEIRAVLALGFDDLKDVQQRLEALKKIRKMPDFEPLAAAFKRTANILKQAKKNNFSVSDTVDESMFKEESEKKLYLSIRNIEGKVKTFMEAKDYMSVLKEMVSIKPDVDDFFVKVMVMAEDSLVRQNRLSILKYIENLFFKVLDFSQLQ
jgi:glycyl-tRNA synthetase beta chain